VTYLSPGVYIEEIPSGPQPISAASTSVVAILGTTRKGPVGKPTRITGWSDFVRTFGAATPRGFTAESMYGFFENGGPAAWVVRVDPSQSATWTAYDVGGNESFVITASSPGAWANDLKVGVAADSSGAAGSLYRAILTGSVTATAAVVCTVPVASTMGLRSGDTVAAVAPASGGAAPDSPIGVVQSVSTASADVIFTTGATLPAGTVLASSIPASTTLFLPTAKGFKTGDILVITAAGGARTSAVIATATPVGSGMAITLEAAATAVPGAAFVQRRTTLTVQAAVSSAPSGTPPATAVSLANLSFPGKAPRPVAAQFAANGSLSAPARIVMADGRTADWASSKFSIIGTAAPPSGTAKVTCGVYVSTYVDDGLSLQDFASAALVDAYGWMPTGTILTLTGAGATTVEATRAASNVPASAFTINPAISAGKTYTTATVKAPPNTVTTTSLIVRCPVAPRVGDAIDIGGKYVVLTSADPKGGDAYLVGWAAAVNASSFTDATGLYTVEVATASAERFALTASVAGGATESFGGLSLNPLHPNYYAKDDVINGVSALVTVEKRGGAAPAIALTSAPFYVDVKAAGQDRPASTGDFVAGLLALEAEAEPAMVICPDAALLGDPLLEADLVGKIITHCEQFRRFAIIDGPNESDDAALLAWRNGAVSSTYAAVYAPHLSIVTIDPDSIDRFTTVPPSGFVAGVFARTDRERGVHKAPGNERVSGIVGLAETYTQRRQDLLNPGSVNLIRAFPGRGTRIWGARNATDDGLWRYVNVRRLFNMIETSVDRSTQWVVFEPNTATTWIRVKVSVENFLDQQWRAGALAGTKPEEAYRVRVGLGETMIEADIDAGLVITEVAIAPAKPAEFVVFRFSHKRLSE